MVTKQISGVEAGQQWGRIVEDVSGNATHYVVENDGKPLVAVVPFRVHEEWERRRDAFFDRMEAAAARADMSPEEAEALVDEAIQAVRRGEA